MRSVGRGSPGLVAPMRALLYARQSRSRAAQQVAFDSGYCAPSAGCTAPLVFLPTSARDPARRGLASCTRAAPWRLCVRSLCKPGGSAAGWSAISAPSDAEDGVPVSAVTAAGGATRAWQLAKSASQLVTPDASWGVIWARHMTPNVASTTRIGARLLQQTRDECVATIANPLIRDGACSVHRTEDGGGGLKTMTTRAAYG